MKVTICEDDALFHDNGIPQIVVIVVEFDDGKTKRLPYPAEKPISALYADLKAIADKVVSQKIDSSPVVVLPREIKEPPKPAAAKPVKAAPAVDKSHIIEKEDIVTCTMIDPGRDSGATCDLIIGQDYRVIQVLGPRVTLPGRDDLTTMVNGYDVVTAYNDDDLRRIRAFPHEVQLKSKRLSKPIEKVMSVAEEVLPCPHCQHPTAMVLDGDEFKGTCEDCMQDVVIARIIVSCKTNNCVKAGNKVSCFDVGDKYAGECNQCGSKVEVPYA